MTLCRWSASALPSWIPLSFPLLGLFLCTPLSAIVRLFFIHLFPVIDPSPVRLSLIGRLVCLHPGGSHRRGRGRGIDSTSSDRRQYSQAQDGQDCAWNHRWCSLLMAIRVSSAPVSCAITGKTPQKSCRAIPYRACGRSSGTGRMTHRETL